MIGLLSDFRLEVQGKVFVSPRIHHTACCSVGNRSHGTTRMNIRGHSTLHLMQSYDDTAQIHPGPTRRNGVCMHVQVVLAVRHPSLCPSA